MFVDMIRKSLLGLSAFTLGTKIDKVPISSALDPVSIAEYLRGGLRLLRPHCFLIIFKIFERAIELIEFIFILIRFVEDAFLKSGRCPFNAVLGDKKSEIIVL